MKIVEMRVHMDCPGCQKKINKVLSKLDGVQDVDIDMNMQKVTVTGWAEQDKVLKTVRKTGRTAELWPYPYNPEYHAYSTQYYGNPTYDYTYGYSSSPATPEPTSTYNYDVHGYNGHEHGYYHQPPSSAIIDDRTCAMFNDDNATGCSIM